MNSIMPMASMPQELTHIDTDGPFIKIWGICNKEKAQFIRNIIQVYSNKLTEGVGVVRTISEFIPGKIVVAFYKGQFHRAEIVQIDGSSARRVLVKLVDLGVSTLVDVTEIRLADGIFNSVSREGNAEECILGGVVVKRRWTEQEVESANQCLAHCTEIMMTGVVAEKRIIQVAMNLNHELMHLNVFLVNAGLAEPISNEHLANLLRKFEKKMPVDQFHVPPPTIPTIPIHQAYPVPQQTPLRATASVFHSQTEVQLPNMPNYHRIRTPKPAPAQNAQHGHLVPQYSYIYTTLPVGTTHEVCVSFVIDGMNAFTVQLKEAVDVKLPKLMARINDVRPTPLKDPLGPGVLCLGRYTEDKSLCRAVVSNVLSEGAGLYFVDFGNSEVVPFNEIYKIPPEFLQEPTMAMRFGLAELSNNYALTTTEANTIFTEMVLKDDNIFALKVTKPENSATQSCELFLSINGKSINIKNKILDKVKLMKPVEYKRINVKKSQVADVLISFAESPSRFFAQLEMNQSLLEVIMNCVQQYCHTSENKDLLYLEDVIENMAVCAKYEDEKWYRGIIVDEPDSEGNVSIFYVDYGNQDIVHFSNLRIMNNEMMSQFPMQALECRLDMDPSVPINEEVNNMFVDMTDGQNFRMTVKSILPAHVLLVDLIDANELSVAEQLKEAFAAKPDTPPISPSNYSAPPRPHLQKSQSGNWREKNAPHTNHKDGDYTSFHGDNPRPSRVDSNSNYSRSDHDDRGRNRNFDSRRRVTDGVDTTDDTWGKKGGDFWGRDKGPRTERQTDSGESWRKDKFTKKFDQEDDQQNDRFNKRPPRNEWNGGGLRDRDDGGRKPYRKRDEEFGDSKRNDEGGNFGRRTSQDDTWGSNNADGERRGSRGGWEKKTSEDESFGGRPRRDNRDGDGWKGKREDGGFHDNRGPRRDNRSNDGGFNVDTWGANQQEQTITDNWQSSSNDRGAENDSGRNRGGSFADNNFGNKREGGFKRRDNDGFSQNNYEKGPKKWNDNFSSRNTVSLLDGFEKGAQLADPGYQPGVEMDVIITWFVNPVRFYVMPSDNADFRNLMEEIQIEYPKRKTINSNELSTNDCVVARDKDNVIYRATVLRTSPRGVVVTFVDYGNTETVGKNQVWAISADHCAIPKQAICCSLFNISPADENGVWKETMQYDKYFSKDGFKLTVVQCVEEENDKSWIVNLTDTDGLDVADQLVADNLAVRKFVLTSEEPYDVSLLLHQTISVYLGAAETAKKFFVHIEPHKADHITTCIETLTENPESLVPLPVEGIAPGEFCLAPSTDNAYYRALILSENQREKQAHVLFIDYGDECDVSFDVIRTLPDHLKIYNAQAVECCLFESESFTNDDDFIKAVEEKDFIIKVVNVEKNKLHVKVFDVNGVSLPYPVESDEIVPAICPMSIIKPVETVMISSLTEEKVYLQRLADQILLTDLNTKLNEKYESEAEQEKVDIEAGKFYAAKSAQFEAWYRCQLAGPESDRVLYIDYGNTEEIATLLAVRPLDEQFYSLPTCCVGVSTSANVTSEAVEPFLVAVQECVFKATFKNTGPNEWFVDLQTEDGKTFGDYVEETNSGSKRPAEPEIVYDAFGNWQLFEEKKVKVSAVYSPSRFYLQLEEDAAKLGRIREDLEQTLKTVLPLVGKSNDLCAAKSDDNKWYRCYQTDNIAIDYGFVINPKQYKKLPASFATDRSKYIVECGLNVESTTVEWNDATIARFKESVGEGNEITAKLESSRNQKVVELTVNGTSVTELLVNEGVVKYKSYQVVLSHVTSLSEFYVQEKESENELFDMLDQLKEAENWETVTPEEGDIVAAKFVDDEQWYRALVTSTAEGVSVRFIDYGNESVSEEFRILPDHLKEIPKFASLCCVHPLPENADELKDKFISFVLENADAPFSVYFLSRTEPMLVMLYSKGCLIEELLKEKPTPTVAFESVSVSHINSPSSFYVQTETPLLDTVAAELENVESSEPVDNVQLNGIYAAKFVDDGLWYRAKSVSNDRLLFVDYGNTSVYDEVRNLPESVKKIPFLAKHCAIPAPSNLPTWPEVATERFAELTCEGNTVFKMDIIEDGDPAYVELKDDGVNVMDELNTLCQAEMAVTSKESDKPTVILSYITSLQEIWVQEQSPSLDDLADELSNVETFDVLETAEENAIVAALFDEDGVWYRAKILEKLDNAFRVLFIDYGNESVGTQIRALPEDLAVMPAFATCCRLFGLPADADQWPSTVLDKLKEISDTVPSFVLEKKIEENGINYVSLRYENTKDLTDELIKFHDELSNQTNPGVVTEANSASEFYIQSDTKAVENVQSAIQSDEIDENIEPVVGDVVSALKEDDNTCYRSKIESIDENKECCHVFRIDFGGSFVTKKWTRLPKEVTEIPPLAIKCSLAIPDDLKKETSDITEQFLQIVKSKDAIFSYKIVNDDENLKNVQLYRNEINVSDLLLPKVEQLVEAASASVDETNNRIEPNPAEEPESVLCNEKIKSEVEPSVVKELVNDADSIRESESIPCIEESLDSTSENSIDKPNDDADPSFEPKSIISQENGEDFEENPLQELVAENLSIKTCQTPCPVGTDKNSVEESSQDSTPITEFNTDVKVEPSKAIPVDSITEDVITDGIAELDVNVPQAENLDEKSSAVANELAEEVSQNDIVEGSQSVEKTSRFDNVVDELVTSELDVKQESFNDSEPDSQEPIAIPKPVDELTYYEFDGSTTQSFGSSHVVDFTVAETLAEQVKEDEPDFSTEVKEPINDLLVKAEEIIISDAKTLSNVTESKLNAPKVSNSDAAVEIEMTGKCDTKETKILNDDMTFKVERIVVREVEPTETDLDKIDVTSDNATAETKSKPISSEIEVTTSAEIIHKPKPIEIKVKPESTVDVVETILSVITEPQPEKLVVTTNNTNVEAVEEDIPTKVKANLDEPDIPDIVAETKEDVYAEQKVSEFIEKVTDQPKDTFHDKEYISDSPPSKNESTPQSGNISERDSLEVNVTSTGDTFSDELDDYKSEILSSNVSDMSKFDSNADTSLNASRTDSLYLSMDEDDQSEKEHSTSNVSVKSCTTFVLEAGKEPKSNKHETLIDFQEKPEVEKAESPKPFDISDNAFNFSFELAESDASLKDCSYSVTYVDNPGSFYVQKTTDTKHLNELEKILQSIEKKSEALKLIEIGSLVGAKIENNCVRAKVLDVDDFSGYIVFCIDYGNETTSKKLFALPDKLRTLPPFVKRCGLPLPAHLTSWPASVCVEFEVITQFGSPTFKLAPLDDTGEIIFVNLTRKQVDVWKKITDLCEECDDEENDVVSDDVQVVYPEKTPSVEKELID